MTADSKPHTSEGFGKRPWVRLWTNEWLDGTTRFQMSDAQRAFWIDLLAMAGRSRYPGIICAGRDGEQWVGYPLSRFQALMTTPIDIETTLALFQQTGKIEMEVTHGQPTKLYKIVLLNWGKYQSDLQAQAARSRKYRQNKNRHGERHAHVTPSITPTSRRVTGVEGEVEEDSEKEKPKTAPQTGAPRKRATLFLEGFELDAEMMSFANDLGIDPQAEFDKFRDHCKANGKTFTDWKAAWRNWARNAKKWSTAKGGSNGSPHHAPRGATSNSGRQVGQRPDYDATDGL
ncbi:MAG TPA: hypothetical protein VJN93_13615 [Candidatus Acidoferrum sp.]|nr:hypothetical protein [Candidatus Acidoferrum sp.]